MAKYTIKINDDIFNEEVEVNEKTRTHTGVRWITITNLVDVCENLKEAKNKYPKAKITDSGEEWFDGLCSRQNQPSN